jgi:hypothetical protein
MSGVDFVKLNLLYIFCRSDRMLLFMRDYSRTHLGDLLL